MKNYKKYMGCLSLFALTLIGCEDLKFEIGRAHV